MSTATVPNAERPEAGTLKALAAKLVQGEGLAARRFDNFILALIIVSLLSIGLEAIAGLPAWARSALRIEELVVVSIFALEYVLRIVAADNKLAFLFSFYGLVDLLAIAPFFLRGLDTRFLRVLRILRVLRVLKVQRRVLENTVTERTRGSAQRNAALEHAQAQIKNELDVARALQVAILPSAFPARGGCDGSARMTPATTMGGTSMTSSNWRMGASALSWPMSPARACRRPFLWPCRAPACANRPPITRAPRRCLARTNDILCTQNPMDLFVTVFYGILDHVTGVLIYANGGHNPPLVARAEGSIEALDGAGGLVLGVMPGKRSHPEHTVQLRPDDRLVLYTDGITEAFNPPIKLTVSSG